MALGALTATASGLLALAAPTAGWFLVVFALAGVAAVAMIITPLSMILGYSPVADRPAYIGLSNTLVAPAAVLAPVLGGWLADRHGYPATFAAAALGGLATALVLVAVLRDPAAEAGVVVAEAGP
jgi:MFS family permease